MITEIGPVEIDVPRDRDGTFEPETVRKKQRRLERVDSTMISLTAKELTTGEVEAHLAEVYSTNISHETISKITDGCSASSPTGRTGHPIALEFQGGCERHKKGCSDASLGREQDAVNDEAAALRSDPCRPQGRRRHAGGHRSLIGRQTLGEPT